MIELGLKVVVEGSGKNGEIEEHLVGKTVRFC